MIRVRGRGQGQMGRAGSWLGLRDNILPYLPSELRVVVLVGESTGLVPSLWWPRAVPPRERQAEDWARAVTRIWGLGWGCLRLHRPQNREQPRVGECIKEGGKNGMEGREAQPRKQLLRCIDPAQSCRRKGQ